MERRKEEQLGSVILRYLRESQLESPLNEHRLVGAWAQVAGEQVERYTESVRIYNQTLYVKLRSPMLRAQLQMQRTELVRKLNASVRANVITDIAFLT